MRSLTNLVKTDASNSQSRSMAPSLRRETGIFTLLDYPGAKQKCARRASRAGIPGGFGASHKQPIIVMMENKQ